LPADELERLAPALERIALHDRQILQERNVPAAYGYFIESGMASLTSRSGERGTLELSTLGRKDFTGIPLVLGTMRSPHRCVVLVPGQALRIRADDFRHALVSSPGLRRVVMRYIQATLVQSSQLMVCNMCHPLAQRLARWLLLAHDHIGRDEIPVTHEHLSRAFGVRRASITLALARMEELGLIQRCRGRFVALSRAGLEHTSCECYHAIRAEHDRLVAPSVAMAERA
jgi:CRP-like cAMP-binding protein